MPVFSFIIFREEIEAAKTLLFGLHAGAGIGALGSSPLHSFPSPNPAKTTAAQSFQAAVKPSTSRLNSKRAASESNSDSEEDNMGFGDSDYFHDNKYGKELCRVKPKMLGVIFHCALLLFLFRAVLIGVL